MCLYFPVLARSPITRRLCVVQHLFDGCRLHYQAVQKENFVVLYARAFLRNGCVHSIDFAATFVANHCSPQMCQLPIFVNLCVKVGRSH